MKVIGVTGGMASGKSTIARMLAGPATLHVDADKIVHQLMRYDADTIEAIAKHFPDALVPPPVRGRLGGGLSGNGGASPAGNGEAVPRNGPHPSSPLQGEECLTAPSVHSINRAALAAEIEHHPERLATLEHILHPRVRAAEETIIARARRQRLRAVILDIPLLFETDAQTLCDVVIVAYAPRTLRRRRAFARPGMTDLKWEKLIARQLPDHVRHHAADIVIPTSIGKAATRRIVNQLKKSWGLR